MADIFTLIDEYKGLMDEKDRLKDATTENNKELEKKRNELAQAMIDAESPKISRNGFVYSLQDKTKYNKIGGCDEDGFFETLEEHGLKDIIKRTVNPQTLNGAMAGLVEENDGELRLLKPPGIPTDREVAVKKFFRTKLLYKVVVFLVYQLAIRQNRRADYSSGREPLKAVKFFVQSEGK